MSLPMADPEVQRGVFDARWRGPPRPIARNRRDRRPTEAASGWLGLPWAMKCRATSIGGASRSGMNHAFYFVSAPRPLLFEPPKPPSRPSHGEALPQRLGAPFHVESSLPAAPRQASLARGRCAGHRRPGRSRSARSEPGTLAFGRALRQRQPQRPHRSRANLAGGRSQRAGRAPGVRGRAPAHPRRHRGPATRSGVRPGGRAGGPGPCPARPGAKSRSASRAAASRASSTSSAPLRALSYFLPDTSLCDLRHSLWHQRRRHPLGFVPGERARSPRRSPAGMERGEGKLDRIYKQRHLRSQREGASSAVAARPLGKSSKAKHSPSSAAARLVPSGVFAGERLREYLARPVRQAGHDRLVRRGATPALHRRHRSGHRRARGLRLPGIMRDVPISTAVRASAGLIPFYAPQKINGRYYVDGGFTRTTNMRVAVQAGATMVVIIDPLIPVYSEQAGFVRDKGRDLRRRAGAQGAHQQPLRQGGRHAARDVPAGHLPSLSARRRHDEGDERLAHASTSTAPESKSSRSARRCATFGVAVSRPSPATSPATASASSIPTCVAPTPSMATSR